MDLVNERISKVEEHAREERESLEKRARKERESLEGRLDSAVHQLRQDLYAKIQEGLNRAISRLSIVQSAL